jgi:hypothetical protein
MMIRFLGTDSIMCGLSEIYEIHVYNPHGEVIKKVAKNFNPIIVNDIEIQKRALEREKDLPKYFPAFQNLFMDEGGRIYIQTYERHLAEDKYYYDIFDPKGKYIVKAALPALPKYWRNGSMYTVEDDEDGYLYVKRYKVIWNY